MTLLVLVLECFLIWGPWMNADGFIFNEKPVGEITPINPQTTVNGTLKLNCTVFEESGLNTSHLFWIMANDSRAPLETMTASGERTLLFEKKITSIDEEGTFMCLRNDETDILKSIVSSCSVVIEYEPVRDVTNFTCMLDEKKDEFYCSWELGPYNHIAYLNITIVMSPDNGMSVIPCPQMVKGQKNCTWTGKDDAANFSMSKIVILNITNMEFKVTKSFRRDFTNQSILKPLPTRFINATSMDSCEDANVMWDLIPGGMDTSSQITLRSKWNIVPLNYSVNGNDSLVVHNLVPASNYTVEVRIKPLGGLYFSEAKRIDFVTCHKAPARAPRVLPSGYFSEDCNAEKRIVTVYWERIPEKFQNGPLTHYVVSSGTATEGEKVSPNVSSWSINGLPCVDSNIAVRGCNLQGCSPKSIFYIPAHDEVIPPSRVIMEKTGVSEVQLSWFGVKRKTVMAVDVVWCKVYPAVSRCQDEVRLLRRNDYVNHTIIHANDVGGVIDNVIIGVAVLNKRSVSSGIKWQDKCRYVKDADPPRIQEVSFLPDPPENSLTVNWSPLYCDQTAPNNAYIHLYRITYCQLQSKACSGDEISVDVPVDSNTQYTIRNLVADARYRVSVRAVSLTREGPKSEMKIGFPTNNDLPDGAIAGIAIGAAIGFVLVCAGIVFLWRQMRRKLGLDDTFPIEPIPIATNTNLPSGNHLYTQLTTPADRSISPLITCNGCLPNGDVRQSSLDSSYETILPTGQTVDLDKEVDKADQSLMSGPKSNGMILSVGDVPRQISRDSGRGSLSPTSTHGQPIIDDLEKEQALKEMLNGGIFPPGYSKATIVANHCLQGVENYSYNSGESCFPMDSGGSSKNVVSLSSSSNSVFQRTDYVRMEDCLQANKSDKNLNNPAEDSKGISDLKEPEQSDTDKLENERQEVVQTSAYVFYQPNNTHTTDGHQSINNGNQCSNIPILAISLSNNTQTPKFAADQPVDNQTPKLAADWPVDTQTPKLAADQPVDTQTPMLLNELHKNVYQPDSKNLTTNNQPNNTVNEYRRNSGYDHDQLMDYIPNDTNFSELMDGYVPNSAMDQSVMSDGPNSKDDERFSMNNSESAQSDHQECFSMKQSDNGPSHFSSQDAKALSSGKIDDANYDTSDVASAVNQEARPQSTKLSSGHVLSNVSSTEDCSSGDVDVHCDSSYVRYSRRKLEILPSLVERVLQ